MLKGYLRALDILNAKYQEEKMQQTKSASETRTPLYFLKLRSKIHVEEFLKYLKQYPEVKYRFSKSSSRGVVTSARVLRGENRFEDASTLLERVIDRGIESDITPEKLHVRHPRAETYRASASGRGAMATRRKA